MAKNTDDNLGRMLDYLDEAGLSEDTIVLFTADHGEMLGSHGHDGKMLPYAEAVDIPLVVRWPGHVPAGLRTDVLHTPLDHVPTLCGLVGLDAPATADGMDLSRVLLAGESVDRDAVLLANYTSHSSYFDTGTRRPEWRAVRTRQYTYVEWLAGREALYDNLDDPHQMRDLAEQQHDLPTLQTMRGRLKELLADAHDAFLPGTAYAAWYDETRNLVETALGPV